MAPTVTDSVTVRRMKPSGRDTSPSWAGRTPAKSTLLNALLGQKLSIVSNKPQTTRHRVVGILTGPGFQVVFLDTPGMIEPKYLLQNAMMKMVQSALRDADLVVRLVDASDEASMRPDAGEEALLGRLTAPVLLVVNKTDVAPAARIRAIAERAAAGPHPPRESPGHIRPEKDGARAPQGRDRLAAPGAPAVLPR